MEIDLSNLPLPVRRKMDEIFRSDFDLSVLKAIRRQTAAAKALRDRPPAWKTDFGPQTLSIDPFVDALWRQFYGHNYTEDREKVNFLVKRNEEIAVRARPGRLALGFSRFGGCTKRFQKRYA